VSVLFVVVEAGAAGFLKPVFEAWRDTPPDFEWSIALTDKSADVLGPIIDPGRIVGTNLDRTSAAPVGAILDKVETSAILCSAGGHALEHAVIDGARARAIPTVQFIDTWYNYRRRLEKNGQLNLPGKIAVIDDVAVQEAVAEGLPEERLTCLGHPGLARIPLLPPTADRKTLFIGAPARRDYGHSLGYTEATSWALAKQVQKKRPDLISDLAYAPHPEEAGPPDAETPCRRYDFGVLESDYGQVLGMFSTPLIEAFLAGRRAVSVQPDALGTDMWSASRQDLAPRALDEEDLVRALETPIPDPTPLRARLSNAASKLEAILGTVQ